MVVRGSFADDQETLTKMYAEPMILPLDVDGKVYAIQDEQGKTIGTGTREVCEVLLYMMRKQSSANLRRTSAGVSQRSNVRAAISL